MDRGQSNGNRRWHRALIAPLLAAFVLLASAAAAQASTIVVNDTGDPSGAGACLNGGQCSLRQAVASANSGDTVQLPAGDYGLTLGSDIDIAKSVTIEGDTTSDTTIDGSANNGDGTEQTARILRTDSPANITIEDLTLTGGLDGQDETCANGCGNTLDANGGGALFNSGGSVTLDDVAFTGNISSAPLGGAVSNGSGTLSMTNVSFTNNSSGLAGALFVRSGTVSGNGVTFQEDRTTCCEGGAAYLLGGTVTFTNTTIVDSAGLDGTPAIANGGATLTLDNDTLSDNPSDIQTDTSARTTAENTIFGSVNGPACEPPGRGDETNGGTTGPAITTDGGNNIDQDTSCSLTASGDISSVDPMLGPIADNGGPTLTEALLSGSPAIGAANEANCPATDQRGVTRANPCDIGAFEVAPSSPPPGSPPPSSPPASNPSPPTVQTTAPTISITSAGFAGSVTPNGLATQAYFQYGLDPKYSGGGAVVYDQSTQPQSVGSDFANHSIGPIAVASLLPNAVYHVRLVATNSDGTTFGPDVTFTTEAAPAPSAPTLGKTFNVAPVSGFVLIKIHGKFVPLTGLDQIPSGSQIDARHGSLELITSNGIKGKTQHGTFGGAIFKLTQQRSGPDKGLVTLTLAEGAFKGAPSYALCRKHQHKAGDASAAAVSSKVLQLLHASAHGKFRTSGRYSAATVRGTIWTVADRCDGTLTHDVTDSVAVKDFVHHKTIILHAGQSYLALAPK